MFLIFGKKPVVLHQITPISTSCKFCESRGTVTLSAHSTHTHLYYLPIFPLGIKVTAYCSDCTFKLEEKEFPEEYNSHAQIVKNNSKTPLWQFTGLIIIALAIFFIIINSHLKKSKEDDYINSPITGDVYHYKADYKSYSTMKVVSVYEDSIFYIHNSMEADMSTMLSELNVEKNYNDNEIYFLLIKDLDSLQKSGALIDIIRDEN